MYLRVPSRAPLRVPSRGLFARVFELLSEAGLLLPSAKVSSGFYGGQFRV